jgi:hypothetical protein
MTIRLLAPLLLVLAMPLGLSAHEATHEAVVSTYTTALRAGEQVVATATCPPGMEVLTGGYKLLHGTVTMRALVVVENRPAPQARQWLVALLYDPAPGETPQGDITLETSAVCRPAPQMGQRHL